MIQPIAELKHLSSVSQYRRQECYESSVYGSDTCGTVMTNAYKAA
ncbi:hypothetical protein [Staphylococcus intermedius]|nr:hypothetical protein [Staphylococcus intermedius]